MTIALSLLELPASREHEQIATKEEPAINEAMIKKFIAYLDVSRGTLSDVIGDYLEREFGSGKGKVYKPKCDESALNVGKDI